MWEKIEKNSPKRRQPHDKPNLRGNVPYPWGLRWSSKGKILPLFSHMFLMFFAAKRKYYITWNNLKAIGQERRKSYPFNV